MQSTPLFQFTGRHRTIVTVLLLVSMHGLSLAGTIGGLQKAQSTTEDIKIGLYALVGSGAGLYLLYLGLMAKLERKSWSDFGMGIVHVGVVGAALTLGTWAWAMFA
ncbi:TrbC/VirB2 family protein [Variovorax saccharolyticus]|uniref:TrbC/VirB2 family protein n=1 Tax=Variovorax saccharolyticus TaxID=3053516 RepID=UPI0025785714|nr:TrbC/VirB2 family protein [Variovorax sp. J31P216]MDM0029123.1 TrbC/VirB2 family protein [Variovorax sp. J31P216]